MCLLGCGYPTMINPAIRDYRAYRIGIGIAAIALIVLTIGLFFKHDRKQTPIKLNDCYVWSDMTMTCGIGKKVAL